MDIIGFLGLGFSVALDPINILYCFIGVLLGTLVGVLPGIGPTATIAMLLPITFSLSPAAAQIMGGVQKAASGEERPALTGMAPTWVGQIKILNGAQGGHFLYQLLKDVPCAITAAIVDDDDLMGHTCFCQGTVN